MPNPVYPRRRRRAKSIATILGGALAALLLSWFGFGPKPAGSNTVPARAPSANSERSQTPAEPLKTGTHESASTAFDFYLLALSLAPAFCELEPENVQCRTLNAELDQKTPLTLHGLWPELNATGRYPSNCDAPKLDIQALDARYPNAQRLRLMPGGDRLARHEWSKHGSCTGLSAEQYFSRSLRWTDQLNGLLAQTFEQLQARQAASSDTELTRSQLAISPAEFRAQLTAAAPHLSQLAQSVVLSCRTLRKVQGVAAQQRKNRPHLTELRVCLKPSAGAADTDLADPQLLECASVDRIDQGCGKQFYLDSP